MKNADIAYLIKEKVVADILKMDYHKLKRERYAGKISFVKLGRSIRYRNSDIQNYLSKNAVGVKN